MIAGRYALDREIGRGGSGVVWLGRDEVLGRVVALKRIGLLPGADQTDLARAEREARLSAQLNHPHVVAVFDVVVDAESQAHWLVMEYVDGLTLDQVVKRQGRLTPDEAAPLVLQAADALVAAHAAGIAHRDVKPSNILVDRDWQVKLTDFGIARIASDPALTQTGMVTGSPAYLAPEIATGGRSDEAADVWSLGATLFHLLAGRPPYEVGDHVLGALYRIVNEEPPRLADAGWLTPLLEHTMVRDPAQRWSMTQVRDFLAGHGRPPTAEPVEPVGAESTLVMGPASTSAPLAPRTRGTGPSWTVLGGLLLAALIVLGLVLYAVLHTSSPTAGGSGRGSGSSSSGASAKNQDAKPTAAGMESFIRDYVATVSSNPDAAWKMLTPKFQVESGGIDTYRSFWDSATNGRVLSISADPRSLVVSYQVHFDNFRNGPGPTVLQLVHQHGQYLIDGESTQGFVPAG